MAKQGLAQFRELSGARRRLGGDLQSEVATRARDPFESNYMGVIRPNDSVLLDKGGGADQYRIYRDLKRDGKVFSGLQKRALALIGRPWLVEPVKSLKNSTAATTDAEIVADILKQSGFDKLCKDILEATLMGWAIDETIWGIREGQIVPLKYRKRAQRRFVYVEEDGDDQLRMLVQEDMVRGIVLPERKFIVHCVNPEDENPYGTGLGHQLYWPVFFKRKGLIAWNKLNDRFGSPTPWGKYRRGASPAEKATLFDALRALSNDGVVITPDDAAIELLESKLTGSISSQAQLCAYMDDWIAEVILGQEPRTQSGGALASASKERRDVRLDLVQADADLLSETLNSTLLPWICELNGLAPCQVYRVIKEEEDLKAQSETDKNVYVMGFKPTLDSVRSKYGDGWDAREQPPAGTPSMPAALAAFAEAVRSGDQDEIDRVLDGLPADRLAQASVAMIQPILDVAQGALSYDDLLARCQAAYPKMDTSRLQAMLANALFGAETYGRLTGDSL